MVYRKPGKNSLKKRSQLSLILGVSEEVKGFRVYLMDDKKVVNTQHVKYIETLSREQNSSLLLTSADDGVVDYTGPTISATSSRPVGGATQQPSKPIQEEPEAPERMLTRTADKRKPSRRIRDILASCINEIENDEYDENVILCNAVENSPGPRTTRPL
jgi:hypothetical protein